MSERLLLRYWRYIIYKVLYKYTANKRNKREISPQRNTEAI